MAPGERNEAIIVYILIFRKKIIRVTNFGEAAESDYLLKESTRLRN
jgi:hypothetical protein